MAINVGDAEPQRDFGATIPDGTYCKVKLVVKPGLDNCPGIGGDDLGLFRRAKPPSDAIMLEAELTVLPPSPHAKRKIFQMWTIHGGKVDEKGQSIAWNITKSALRAMVESACGISPEDQSAQAVAARQLPSFRSLNGIEFYARISVESDPQGQYADQNRIGHIVVPGEPEYALLAAGQIPEPHPARGGGQRRAASAAAPAVAKPAWQTATPTVAAAAAPAAGPPAASAAAAPPAAAPQPASGGASSGGPAWLRQ